MMQDSLNGYTVAQLKEFCSSRGLETVGRKVELVERLRLYITVNPDDDLAVELEQAEEEEANKDKVSSEEEEANKDKGENKDGDEVANDKDNVDAKPEIKNEDMEAEMEVIEAKKEDEEVEMEAEKEDIEAEKNETEAKGNGGDEKLKSDDAKDKTDTKVQVIRKGPNKFQFRHDRALHGRIRTLLVGPINPEMMAREEIVNLAKACVQTSIRLNWDEEKKMHQGFVEYHFKTVGEAVDAEKNFPKFEEDLKIVRLTETVTFQSVTNKGDNPRVGPLDIRTVAAWNISQDIKEEELKSLFSEVQNKLVIHNSEDKFQGTIYLHYDTVEEAKKALEAFQEKDMTVDGSKINFGMLDSREARKRARADTAPAHTPNSEGNSELISPENRDKMTARIKSLEDKFNQRTLHPNTTRRIQKQIQGLQARLERDHQLRVEQGLVGKKRRQRRNSQKGKINQQQPQGQQTPPQQQQRPTQQQQQKPKQQQQQPKQQQQQQNRNQTNRQQQQNRPQQKRRFPQQQNRSFDGGMMNPQQNRNFGGGMLNQQSQQLNTGAAGSGALDLLVGLSSMLSSSFQRQPSTFQQQPSQSVPKQKSPNANKRQRQRKNAQRRQNASWQGGAFIDRQGSYGGQQNQSYDDYEPASKRQSVQGSYGGGYGNRSSSPVRDTYNNSSGGNSYNSNNNTMSSYRYADDDDVDNFGYTSSGGNYQSNTYGNSSYY